MINIREEQPFVPLTDYWRGCSFLLCFKYMGSKVLGIGYIRVSSGPQTEGVSLDVQEENVRRVLKLNHCTDIRIFNEGGKSGKLIEERDDFIEALKYALENNAQYFAVYDTSRFARLAERSITIFKQLVRQGTVFLSATGRFDNTPEGIMLFSLLAVMDEYQSNKSGEKIRDAKKKAKELGLILGVAPAGYLNVRNKNRGDIIIDAVNGPILKEALLMFGSGEFLTQIELADFLTERGFTYKRLKEGRPIMPQFVSKILRNPQYCGYKVYLNGELSEPHPYDPLISTDVFLAIQERLDPSLQANVKHKKLRDELPLRQLAVCEKCNRRLYGYKHHNDKGQEYWRYACKTKGCCKSTQASILNKQFETILQNLEMDEGKINLFKTILLRHLQQSDEQLKRQHEVQEKRVKEAEQKLEGKYAVLEKITEPLIIDRFQQEILKKEAELKEMRSILNSTTVPENYAPLIERTVPKLKKPHVIWDKGKVRTKVMFQKWLLPAGITYSDKPELRIPELCCVYETLSTLEPQNPLEYRRQDSNLHSVKNYHLKVARIPVPPRLHNMKLYHHGHFSMKIKIFCPNCK